MKYDFKAKLDDLIADAEAHGISRADIIAELELTAMAMSEDGDE